MRPEKGSGSETAYLRISPCCNSSVSITNTSASDSTADVLKGMSGLIPRHKPLEYVKECPNYIISSGIRSGCRFPKSSLPVFTDINFCVNGSSSEGPLQPQFISLQIQNHGTHAGSPAFQSSSQTFIPEGFSPCYCFHNCISSETSDCRESVCARRPRPAGNKMGVSCWQCA